jgi:hypothetical protein
MVWLGGVFRSSRSGVHLPDGDAGSLPLASLTTHSSLALHQSYLLCPDIWLSSGMGVFGFG